MRAWSLRTRVALAAALAVFLAVALLGGASKLLISHELRSSLDRGLTARATQVARLSASAPALLTTPGTLDAANGGLDLVVEVVDRRQRIVARSATLGGRLLQSPRLIERAIRDGQSGFGRVLLSGEEVRVFVAPLPAGGSAGGGAVIVGASTAEIDHTTDRIARLLLLGALAAAALGAAVAAALTARGMRPLERLRAGASEIRSTGDVSRRLPASGTRDVGELTETLNGMLAALERAQATERRFLADASHELRTPVTALVGNVDYLARHGADPAVVADLQDDARRLARLIDDLLTLERGGDAADAGELVDLGDVAHRAVRDAPCEAEIIRVLEPGEERVTVTGDAEVLHRAVLNLITNAAVHGKPPIEIDVRRSGDRAQLSVSDSGAGIPAGQTEDAFGRFWRGPDASGRPGSGLGLALVRAAARAHGGDVTARGATFTIDLPIVRGPSESGSTLDSMPSDRFSS